MIKNHEQQALASESDQLALLSRVQDLEKEIYRLQYTDTLTGLGNRELFLAKLDEFFQQVEQGLIDGFFLTAIDFDNFKKVDDLYGYKVGDKLIRESAQRLLSITNESDVLFRVSGTKLGILHPVDSANVAEEWSHHILQTLAEVYYIEEHIIELQVSMGLLCLPEDAKDSVEAINRVELAYYKAKETKNYSNVVLYYPQLNEQTIKVLAIEKELIKALANDNIEVYYQPQFSLPERQLQGFEALARWRHPQQGLISPTEFIPIAEETGLIIAIGNRILEQACEQSVLWTKKGFEHTLSVNISIVQLKDPKFLTYVTDILQKTGVNPNSIEFEITENIFMGNIQDKIGLLKKLKKLGISIAIDDFGTGYSSLNYIKEFPLDILKIDRTFIKNIPQSRKDCAIAKTILILAKELFVKVVAEGMEEEEQVLFLEQEKCDSAQGYYFSQPLEVGEAGKLVDSYLNELNEN